jgi:hypothetical protein
MASPPEFLFCFTVDTEPDNLWGNRPVLSYEHFRQLPEFHQSLCRAGARPTYLTTSEVAESEAARKALEVCRDRYPCEIGAHYHTWTREWPFSVPDLRTPPLHAMAHQLGQQVEEAMLSYTCEALRRAFRTEPRSYRGGRWSLGPESETSLRNCGISVDSTVTPGIDWRDSSDILVSGPDYRKASRHPHTVSGVFGKPAGSDGVLEIPVGAAWFPSLTRHCGRFATRQLSRVGRLTRTRLGHRWLRPTGVALPDMIATMKSLRADRVPVWVFMIHSSEILPCKPLPTQADVEAFSQRCEGAVVAAVELGAKPATLTEAAVAVRAQTLGHGA